MYISDISQKWNRSIEVGDTTKKILLFFTRDHVLSAYRCRSLLLEEYKKLGKTISYKNVYGKIKQLESAGLIKAVNTSKHGAINMKITSLGIFFIHKNKLHYPSPNIIADNKMDGLYESFLYPLIKYKTIIKVTDSHILNIVFDYLAHCCNLLEEVFGMFQSLREEGVANVSVASTESITDPELRDLETVGLKGFIDYLIERFDLKWLNNDKTITKVKRVASNEIIITKGRKKIIIKLIPDELKALILYQNSCIGELPIERMPNDDTNNEYIFMEYKRITAEEMWELPNFYIHNKFRRLRFDLVNHVLNYCCMDFYMTNKELKTKTESLKLMQLDSNFNDLVKEVTASINFCYDRFMSIK
jgi:hypothetical protein